MTETFSISSLSSFCFFPLLIFSSLSPASQLVPGYHEYPLIHICQPALSPRGKREQQYSIHSSLGKPARREYLQGAVTQEYLKDIHHAVQRYGEQSCLPDHEHDADLRIARPEQLTPQDDKIEGHVNALPTDLPQLRNTTERKLMAKIDWHLMPCLCVMYLLAFLDRYEPDWLPP